MANETKNDEINLQNQDSCNQSNDNEFLALAQRIQADFDNYRKRTKAELEEARKIGFLSALKCVFKCIDDIEQAKKTCHDKTVIEGLNLIENGIIKDIEKLGIKKISALGHKFDPSRHNAIAIVENKESKPNMVIQEVQSGYTYDDKVIRYSQVVVSKDVNN